MGQKGRGAAKENSHFKVIRHVNNFLFLGDLINSRAQLHRPHGCTVSFRIHFIGHQASIGY